MSDQSTGVGAGTLSGINLSGEGEDVAEAALPVEDERTAALADDGFYDSQAETTPDGEPPVQEPAVEPPVAPTPEEPQTAPEPPQEPSAPPELPDAPPAPEEPAGKSTAKSKRGTKGAPARPYIVLKQDLFEDSDEPYFTKVHEVTARNAQNAMRQAFKDLSEGEGGAAEAVLVVIPASMFRPTPVRLNKTERVSVSFG